MKKRTGNLYQRTPGGAWHVRVRIDSKTITKSLGTANRREAERLRAEFMAPYHTGDAVDTLKAVAAKLTDREAELAAWEAAQNPPPELDMVWLRFEGSPERPDSGDATLRQYESEWRRFRAWLERERPAVAYLHEVTQADAAAYVKDLTAARVSASTYNQHRGLLRMLWRVLADECRLAGNPWDKITTKKLTPLATRKRALTGPQFDSLLAAVETDPDMHDLFVLLAWTGLRLADAVLMKWGAADFRRRVLTITPMKTARRQGKQVFIPMFPAVLAVLNRRQQGRVLDPAGHVFPELAEQYRHDAPKFSNAISEAFERAGMQTTEERADRKRAVVVFGAHSLRHYFTTQAAASGMPDAMLKTITGHATDGMLAHYQQIGADLASELATRIQGAGSATLALPLPEPSDAARMQFDALRARVRELAEQLDGDNWETVKTGLLATV